MHVRRELLDRLEPALHDRHRSTGGTDKIEARALESWETNVAGRLGLGRALDYALDLGLEPIRERVAALAESLRARLAAVPAVRVHDRGLLRCGIVTFSVDEKMAEQVKAQLSRQKINVSTAALPPSAAPLVLDPAPEQQTVAVRASVHYYNTEDDLDRLIAALS